MSIYQQGQRFHDWVIGDCCGEGAFGAVFRATDLSGQDVALKIIQKGMVKRAWEAELKGVSHFRQITAGTAHLVRIFHVGEDDETFFYSMELADDCSRGEGEYVPDTLERRLGQGRMGAGAVLELASALLKGIESIHVAGMIHQDIKPANVIYVGGQAKISDVGMMSSVESIQSKLSGTLEFIPPEVRSGSSPSSQRNDFYALGKIMYCALTGEGADQFPHWPRDLALSYENHLILMLVLRLCNSEVSCRMDELEKIRVAFERTGERLLMGGRWYSWLSLSWSRFLDVFLSGVGDVFRAVQRHVLLSMAVVFCVLVLSVVGIRWWNGRRLAEQGRVIEQMRLESEFEAVHEHDYVSERFGIGLTLPGSWKAFLAQRIEDVPSLKRTMMKRRYGNDFDKQLHRQLLEEPDILSCENQEDGTKVDINCVVVENKESVAFSRSLLATREENLRRRLVMDGQMSEGKKPEDLWGIERGVTNGIDWLRYEETFQRDKERRLVYYLMFPDHGVVLTLISEVERFAELKAQFEAVMATVREVERR